MSEQEKLDHINDIKAAARRSTITAVITTFITGIMIVIGTLVSFYFTTKAELKASSTETKNNTECIKSIKSEMNQKANVLDVNFQYNQLNTQMMDMSKKQDKFYELLIKHVDK